MALSRGLESLNRPPERRGQEFRDLMRILDDSGDHDEMSPKDYSFYCSMHDQPSGFVPSEPQLSWLRDLAQRYAQ